jgi:hypothetical protein
VTLGVLYNPWTGEATREWIMGRIAGENGDGFEAEGLASEDEVATAGDGSAAE